ncbi:Double-strand break repair protein MRE11 [Vitis vinifera]|uniref:Double-strand break repair protein MRE11 n=1 Tax=Vitis vinifera TaxID=29760 RepID=A0A438DLY2_VITVI|nr:Double-strand break repair protein MRE11 [Vitis vinifera]
MWFLSWTVAKIDDSERLRPEELNQQNIEALVAENNLKMEILPVNDLDVALHNFVNKDDKWLSILVFNIIWKRHVYYVCVFMISFFYLDRERVKERSVHSKETPQFMSSARSLENIRSKGTAETGSAVSFSDAEDPTQLSGSKSATRGRKGSSATFKSSHDASEQGKGKTSTRGRGRGRGRGRSSSTLKQMTLDSSLGFRHSESFLDKFVAADLHQLLRQLLFETLLMMRTMWSLVQAMKQGNMEINEVDDSSKFLLKENDENLQGKGHKRAAPRGRGRGATTSSKRGRKSDSTSIQRMLMNKDDDDDDEDDMSKRLNKPQPRVSYIHLSNKELWCSKKRQIDVDMYITHLKLYAHLLHIAVGGCCTVDNCFRVLHCGHHSNGHWKLNDLTVSSLRGLKW